jgi:tight adherence protein B
VRGRLAAIPLFVGVLLALGAAGAGADVSSRGGVTIRHIDTNAFPSVAVTISVPEGQSVDSLHVTENGRPVRVLTTRTLAQAGKKLDVVLAVDTSDSVAGAPLAAAVEAAQAFLNAVPPDVGIGLLTFSDKPRVLVPVTTDRGVVSSAIASLTSTQHGTVLYDAVGAASRMFQPGAEHNIILLTDGADVGSGSNEASAVRAAKGQAATIFTVGLGDSADVTVLQSLARETGGSFAPASPSNVEGIYRTLAGALSNQYVVVYQSRAVGGSEVTIGVKSDQGGSDQSFVQLPRLAAAPESGGWDLSKIFANEAFLIGALGILFVAIFLLLAGAGDGVMKSMRDRSLARRMAAPTSPTEADGSAQDERQSWVPAPIAQAGEAVADIGGFKASLERTLERAGLPITPGELVGSSVCGGLVIGLIAALILRSPLLGLALAAVTALAPILVVRHRMKVRIEGLHEQLPDVLMILASSMRAGHSFLQAVDTVAKEIGPPSDTEFARVVSEIRLGRPASEALTAMGERVGTEEFRWAMLAVNVQSEVGGNLAEILDTLAETVREREAIRRQVKVLSAEGRLSMKIMAALPPLVALAVAIINPGYMRVLWTTRIGWILIGVGLVLMTIGALVARRLVKIDV